MSSDIGSLPDDDVNVDELDTSAIETAVDSLLDKSQKFLDYPYQDPPVPNTRPSAVLNYKFTAEIEVSLDTSWTLFSGLTLTNILLTTRIAKANTLPGQLYVRLSATATIGDATCKVTGVIPRLSTVGPIDFILCVEVDNRLETLPTDILVSSLTDASLTDFTSKLDTPVSEQIEGVDELGNNEGISYAASAYLVVTRDTTGTFFLKQLAFGLEADIGWSIIPNQLQLFDLSLSIILSRNASGVDFDKSFGINAGIIVGDVRLAVLGQVEMAAGAYAIDLSVMAKPMSNITPETVLQALLSSDPTTGFDASKYDSAFNLPPSADFSGTEYSTVGQLPFTASLSVKKDDSAGAWYISAASVKVDWDLMCWYPLPGVNLAVSRLYFNGTMHRDPTKEQVVGRLATAPLVYSAAFGGTIILTGASLSALITYQSATSTTTLTCRLDDSVNLSLQDLASDPAVNPDGALYPHNLVAVAQNTPVPDSAPVNLFPVADSVYRTGVLCTAMFDQSTLSQLQLKADLNVNWQITANIQLVNMGIFFDIINPTSTGNIAIQGYICGTITVGTNISIFAFVLGVKDAKAAQFAVGLSGSYNPAGTLGVTSPQSLLTKFQIPGVTSDVWTGWTMPSSAPTTASVTRTMTSIDASMVLQISQTEIKSAPGTYTLALQSLQASISVSGSWNIFDTISLTDLYMQVNVFPSAATTYNVGLAGRVATADSVVDSANYNVVLMALFDKSKTTSFSASVVAYPAGRTGTNVPLSTFFQMPMTGMNGVDITKDPSTNTIPTELPIKATNLLASPTASVTLVVAYVNNAWALQQINASFSQNGTWSIIENQLVVSQSTLSLTVTNPRVSSKRTISFAASTVITIAGSISVTAGLSVSLFNGKESALILSFSLGSIEDAQRALLTLANTSFTTPDGTPTSSTYTGITMVVTCTKINNAFKVSRIDLAAVSSQQWTAGAFTISSLALTATFANINTSMTTTIGFLGKGSIASHNVDLAISYMTQTETLIIQVTSGIQPTILVGAFVTGGLSSSSPLKPPSLASDTGLGEYTTTPTTAGQVVFKKVGSVWGADRIAFVLAGNSEWSLVDNILTAKNLSFALQVTGISSGSYALSAVLSIGFDFAKRPPPGQSPDGQVVPLPCTAVASQEDLVITLQTVGCDMPQFLYTVTGGYWNISGGVPLPDLVSQVEALVLTINWKEGYADFKAVLHDWSLVDSLPSFVGMKEPRFEASITRENGEFSAVGQLAGSAQLVNVDVPLSFDLPAGPFRVCGIDVRKAYEVSKELYEIYKNGKEMLQAADEVAELMAGIGEFLGAADIAADVAAGLAAAGVFASVIDTAISNHFHGGGTSGPTPDQNDPSNNNNNNNTNPGQPELVLGGTFLSPGPAKQTVDIFVYPKDRYGGQMQPFDTTQLVIVDATEGDMAVKWTAVPGGYTTSLPRPKTAGVEVVGYGSLKATFQNNVQQAASVFSLANSSIYVPSPVVCIKQNILVVTPKDQYSQPRYGPNAAPPLVTSFVRVGGGPAPTFSTFGVRNDSLLMSFSLPIPGSYTLTISDINESRAISMIAVSGIDPKKCVIYGEGLCDGPGGAVVQLHIDLKDQSGSAYVPPSNDKPDVQVVLNAGQELNWTIVRSTITTSYTRPASGTFTVNIQINGVQNLVNLTVMGTDAIPSVAESTLSLDNVGTVAQGDLVEGTISLYDSLGHRWYQSVDDWTKLFAIVLVIGSIHQTPSVRDNGDGSYAWQVIATASGNSNISVHDARNELQQMQNSPLSFLVQPPRALTSIIGYGSGLNQGFGQVGTVGVRGVDQYGADCSVVLGTSVSITVLHQQQTLSPISGLTTTTSVSYTMPDRSDDPVYVLMQPLGQATFEARIYGVPLSDPSPVDPSKCFITWDSLATTRYGTSVATLYTVNAAGNRVYTGGCFVQMISIENAPLILTLPVKDNADGSYTLTFKAPTGIIAAPWPQLAVSISRQAIPGSPWTLPIQPSIVTTKLKDMKQMTQAGVIEELGVLTLDASGQISATGFHSATAYIVGPGTSITPCPGNFVLTGVCVFTYTVNVPGDYKLFISINSRPVPGTPVGFEAYGASIDSIVQGYQVTGYTLSSPPEQWTQNSTSWTLNNSNPNVSILTSGAESQNQPVQSYQLALPIKDEWLLNGFMFQFDFYSTSNSQLILTPVSQPATGQLSMVWSPQASGQGQGTSSWGWEYKSGGIKSIDMSRFADRMVVNSPTPTTIGFFYMLSPDKSQYTFAAFQAGQFIAQYSWAKDNTPSMGFTIQKTGGGVSKVAIANITTVPGYFKNIPTGSCALAATASDSQAGDPPSNVLDGNPNTFWHSEYDPVLKPFPHSLTVDLRAVYSCSSLTYVPRTDGTPNGRIGYRTIDSSTDNQTWKTVVPSTLYPDVTTPTTTNFGPVDARYLRLTATSEAGNRGPWSSAATIKIGYVGESPQSRTTVDFHSPWAAKFVKVADVDGTLDNRGLIFDAQWNISSAKNPAIYQEAVVDYGMSVSVFAVSVPAVYDYSSTQPGNTAVVDFAGMYFAPLIKKWIDWGFEYNVVIADASSMLVGADQGPNIVFCINGKSCATVFANGKFQFSVTSRLGKPMTALRPPELYSMWTDCVWHKMKVAPGLETIQEAHG